MHFHTRRYLHLGVLFKLSLSNTYLIMSTTPCQHWALRQFKTKLPPRPPAGTLKTSTNISASLLTNDTAISRWSPGMCPTYPFNSPLPSMPALTYSLPLYHMNLVFLNRSSLGSIIAFKLIGIDRDRIREVCSECEYIWECCCCLILHERRVVC